MSQDLHHSGENSYYSNAISMSEYYNPALVLILRTF